MKNIWAGFKDFYTVIFSGSGPKPLFSQFDVGVFLAVVSAMAILAVVVIGIVSAIRLIF